MRFSASWARRAGGLEGYGAQAKNTKELGTALKLAGVTSIRKTVGDAKKRLYVLPQARTGEDLKF